MQSSARDTNEAFHSRQLLFPVQRSAVFFDNTADEATSAVTDTGSFTPFQCLIVHIIVLISAATLIYTINSIFNHLLLIRPEIGRPFQRCSFFLIRQPDVGRLVIHCSAY